MKKRSVFLIFVIFFQVFPRHSVVLFPLLNETEDELVSWVGYSVPERFFCEMRLLPGFQVWDPVFLLGVDTTDWQMDSKTVLKDHSGRWKWSAAVGGAFTADDDSVWIKISVVLREEDNFSKKELRAHGSIGSIIGICSGLIDDVLELLESESASKKVRKPLFSEVKNINAYGTYAAGYGFEMRGSPEKALSAYMHAVNLDGSFAPALCRIGSIYNKSRDIENSRLYFEKALTSSPESPIITAQMASFMVDHELPEKAAEFILSHRSVLNMTAEGLCAVGEFYMLSGEYERAISSLTQAVAKGPSDLETELILGESYLSSGQYDMAADIFSRLIEYRPYHVRYYSLLGATNRSAGRLMESLNVLESARRIEPDNIPNLVNLSNTYFDLGWYDKAEQLLLQALELNPGLNEVKINLGVIYWHNQKQDSARIMFEQAVKNRANVQSALNNQANMFFLSGNIKDAIKRYRKADKLGMKSETVIYNLGLAYFSLGRLSEAAACFDEALLLSPNRLDILLLQAEIAQKQGKAESSELFYRKILEISPNNKEYLSKYITLLVSQERFKEAVQIIENFLDDFPGDRTFQLLLPQTYWRMKWYEVAVMEYEKLIKDNLFKEEPSCYTGLGRCMYDMIRHKNKKVYDQAIYYLKIASDLEPSDPEPDMMIGKIYMDYKKQREPALEHWKKALGRAKDRTLVKEIEKLIAGATQ